MPGTLRAIPDADKIKQHIMTLHPDGRMTQPEDIAKTLVALMDHCPPGSSCCGK